MSEVTYNDLTLLSGVDGIWDATYIAAAATTPLADADCVFGGIAVTDTAAGVITVYNNYLYGDATSQFDISIPDVEAPTTFRYTFDGTGKSPGWSATTMPVGTVVTFAAQNFSAGNNGTFTVTGSGENYVEVTNADGVEESNKTIGTGNIRKGTAALTTAFVLKASIAEGLHLNKAVALSNGLTVVTAAASKIVVYHRS